MIHQLLPRSYWCSCPLPAVAIKRREVREQSCVMEWAMPWKTLAWGLDNDKMGKNIAQTVTGLRDTFIWFTPLEGEKWVGKQRHSHGWKLCRPLTLWELLHLEMSVVTSRSMIRSTVSVVSRLTSPVLGSKIGTVLRITFSERTRSRSATTFSLGLLITTSLDHLRLTPWLKVVQLSTSWTGLPTHINAPILICLLQQDSPKSHLDLLLWWLT